jgi:flagellar biosynthesis protein FlhG
MDGNVAMISDSNTNIFNLASSRQHLQTKRLKQIWAVGGGKGGVGKSLLSSSLALSLAKTGQKVLGIDLDLGGANLHTTLGIELPKQTLNDFFTERVTHLSSCLTPTSIPNLELISGAQDSVMMAGLSDQQKNRFLSTVRDLDADYLIFDLGAGTSLHTLDFFLFADVNIVTMLPEPTSIENGYRFIKSAYFRRLSLLPKLRPISKWIDLAMDSKNSEGIRSPSDLFKAVSKHHPEMGSVLKQEIERFRPKLVMNQVRTHADIEVGQSVKTVCKKYFGVELDYLGYLDYDSTVWQAIRRKRPVLLEFPQSRLVMNMTKLVDNLTKNYPQERSSL